MRRPSDPEAGLPSGSAGSANPGNPGNPFGDKYVRIGFIRKVYAILSVQLLVTAAIIAAFIFVPVLNKFAKTNGLAMLLAGIGSLVILFVLTCCGNLMRSFPTNFILLFLFTILNAIALSGACVFYKRDEVMMAVGITAVIFILLTMFAMQTAIDFTGCSAISFILIILLLIFGIVVAIFPSRTLQMIYSCIGAAIFCFYIVMDTQLIVGGKKRKNQLSPEDYIAGALMLYMDAINLFLFILEILNMFGGEE
uniref:N-methyl-D-aspartate receptor associated protein n=1 Tax=Rhipicephalus appendiculatus TaxID=34631 RepID=A0A131Z218_RHIAP